MTSFRHLFATPGNFLAIVYCWFFFVAAKEKCPERLVELNFSLCDMLESSIVSYIYIDCDNIKYEKSSGILNHVILPG